MGGLLKSHIIPEEVEFLAFADDLALMVSVQNSQQLE